MAKEIEALDQNRMIILSLKPSARRRTAGRR